MLRSRRAAPRQPARGARSRPRVALVLGSEGGGLRRLVRENCDYLARLPTTEAMPSLNVSTAAAVALYQLAIAGGNTPAKAGIDQVVI